MMNTMNKINELNMDELTMIAGGTGPLGYPYKDGGTGPLGYPYKDGKTGPLGYPY